MCCELQRVRGRSVDRLVRSERRGLHGRRRGRPVQGEIRSSRGRRWRRRRRRWRRSSVGRPVYPRLPEGRPPGGAAGNGLDANVAGVARGEGGGLCSGAGDRNVRGFTERRAVGGREDLVARGVGGLPVQLDPAHLSRAAEVDLPPLVIDLLRAPARRGRSVHRLVSGKRWGLDARGRCGPPGSLLDQCRGRIGLQLDPFGDRRNPLVGEQEQHVVTRGGQLGLAGAVRVTPPVRWATVSGM